MPRWPARIWEAAWLAAAIAVPLAFNPWGANPFELPKTLLLRALVLVLGLAARASAAERGARPRLARLPPSLVWPGLGFGLALALSTLLSVSPRASLWGSYARQQGLLASGAYLALFLFTAAGLRTRAQVERLMAALVWGSAPVVGYGLLQAAGLDPLGWRSDAVSPALSTLGRSNFLGAYLVLVMPLTAGRLALARRRWPYVPLLVAQALVLALTGARGAWIGLGAAASAGLLAWSAASDRRLALAALALAGCGLGLAGLLARPGGERLAGLFDTQAGSTAARLTIWRTAVPLIATRPALGYGPETLRTVFARVFPPELVYYQGRQVTVDRAHNVWLDLALSSGLVGVVAFVSLQAGWVRLAWRGLRSARDHWERVGWAAIVAGVVGHLTELQFSFELTASATLFWLMLGMSAALARGLASAPTSPPPLLPQEGASRNPESPPGIPSPGGLRGRPRTWLPYLPLALAALALAGQVCLRPLLADSAAWRAGQMAQPLSDRLAAAERAVRLWPMEPAYRVRLAWTCLEAGRPGDAERQLASAELHSPDDPAVWAARGELYARWAAVEPARYTQAEAAYRRALALAPNVAAYHTALGLALAGQGRWPEATGALERSVALDATDHIAYGHLAEAYRAQGWESEAAWAEGEARYWHLKEKGEVWKVGRLEDWKVGDGQFLTPAKSAAQDRPQQRKQHTTWVTKVPREASRLRSPRR